MAENMVTIWRDGGTPATLPIQEALEEVRKILDETSEYVWETRVPGSDMEATWGSADFEFRTVQEALDQAMPAWQALGLDQATALILAMDAGLVLATGAEVEEFFTDEE